MVKTWARHKTTEPVLNNGERLAAVGGWWRLVVGSGWLVAVGGPWLLSLRAVLHKKNGVLRTALGGGRWGASSSEGTP